jgi:hypothetical protein
MDSSLNRRKFIKTGSAAMAALPLVHFSPELFTPVNEIPLNWLENSSKNQGVTWGLPWPKNALKKVEDFVIQGSNGISQIQTWPLAYWPDGSLKWTAHALPGKSNLGDSISLKKGKASNNLGKITFSEDSNQIKIDTGLIQALINKKGNILIEQLSRNGKTISKSGSLAVLIQDQPSNEPGITVNTSSFKSEISKVTVEQKGPIRATLKIEGFHKNDKGRSVLPFTVRLYFYANSDTIKVMHTFIYDADENKDFISGIGLKFEVDFNKEELHNRHLRFVGQGNGVFAEAVRGLTGLRRDPGKAVREAQINGKRTTAVDTFAPTVSKRMDYIAAFGDYTLYQPTSDAFEIQKRTKHGHGWVQSSYGNRSQGTAYLGSPSGGLGFGIRNFWQSHPAQLDIRNAINETGEITMWLWAPKASPMDLRFYHDGMGQDTYPKQLDALEINYEDYEPEFGTPLGVARTSEISLKVYEATPSNAELADFAEETQNPCVIVATPEYLHKAKAFGAAFALPVSGNEKRNEIEKQLNFYFDYYKNQIDQHHWYGFWNYGDVMHTFDEDRHVWRYDVGGYAWDNSELSTDIWLWTYFLSTGRADVFRMAEAMTRHTGEVDVHHIGRFSPLGSRHNVYHWGCSAKQLRISTAANRRYYYYLTGDERVGDLMREQIDAVKTLQSVVPIRKVNQNVPKNTENTDVASVGFGTDWGAIAAAWLTEWERTQSPEMKTKLLNSMQTIAAQPHGFFTGYSFLNLKTGKFEIDKTKKISVSHLSAVFGLPEICFELVEIVNDPGFTKAWLDYCRHYNGSPEEQTAQFGEPLKKLNLQQGHARLTAYAAYKLKDKKLGERAWAEFYKGEGGFKETSQKLVKWQGPDVLNAIEEGPGISTNAVAQWGLAAMQCLAYASDDLR